MSNFPIFTACFNNGWMIKRTVETLTKKFPSNPITVFDNGSTHPKTLQILTDLAEAKLCQIIYKNENVVPPRRFLDLPEYANIKAGGYIFTDPDLELEKLPEDTFEVFYNIARERNAQKVGPALDISEPHDMLPNTYYGGKTIAEWESSFWSYRIPDHRYELYGAAIDSTLYLYNPHGPKTDDPYAHCIRVADKYKVKHLPWHISYILNLDPEDFESYFSGKYSIQTNTADVIRNYLRQYHPNKFQLYK